MRAGKRRHRVLVDEKVVTEDEIGGAVVSWKQRGSLFASIEPIRGREALQANELIATMDTRINVRWGPLASRITAQWRLRHGKTIYAIAAPPAELKLGRREIEIMCKSGATNG